MLVQLSVMEQRYQAVLAVVQDGWQISEVARRLGVSRQRRESERGETGGRGAVRARRSAVLPSIAWSAARSASERGHKEGGPGWRSPANRSASSSRTRQRGS